MHAQVFWHNRLGRLPRDRLFDFGLRSGLQFFQTQTTTNLVFARAPALVCTFSGAATPQTFWFPVEIGGAFMFAGGWKSNVFLDYLRSREFSVQVAGALEFSFWDSDADRFIQHGFFYPRARERGFEVSVYPVRRTLSVVCFFVVLSVSPIFFFFPFLFCMHVLTEPEGVSRIK